MWCFWLVSPLLAMLQFLWSFPGRQFTIPSGQQACVETRILWSDSGTLRTLVKSCFRIHIECIHSICGQPLRATTI
jgi:hypothetical protein